MTKGEKVVIETPTPGKQPTRIDKWKYDLVHDAILAVVPADENGVEFSQLAQLVEAHLSSADLARLGSVSWYTTTIKLDMEVKGEIERIQGSKPQRLRRT
ncbi:MAG: hypothetical protein GWN30_12095 [Gammaproteobacteria bacterium]|nr:hypothetical protein [Gammaproteobacteria bacterium]